MTVLFVAALTGCREIVPRELADARAAFKHAEKNNARALSPTQYEHAKTALHMAERLHRFDPFSRRAIDSAYLAHRQALLADVQADTARYWAEKGKSDKIRLSASPPQYQVNRDKWKRRFDATRIDGEEEQSVADLAPVRPPIASRAEDQVAAVIREGDRGTVVAFPTPALFSRGQWNPTRAAVSAFDQLADALGRDGRLLAVVSIDAGRDNDPVSLDRAAMVRRELLSRGVSESRILVVTYDGDENSMGAIRPRAPKPDQVEILLELAGGEIGKQHLPSNVQRELAPTQDVAREATPTPTPTPSRDVALEAAPSQDVAREEPKSDRVD
jgi:hypothetical protein